DSGHDVRVLGRQVVFLTDVVGQIVKLSRGGALLQALAYALPVAHSYRLLATVAGGLPVEELVLVLLTFAPHGWKDAQSVAFPRDRASGDFTQSRHHVVKHCR